MFLLDDILLAPLSGLLWVGEKLDEAAQHEFSDEGLIKEKLMELQLRFEMDEIGEKEYNKQEAELLARLDAVRKVSFPLRGVQCSDQAKRREQTRKG